MLQAMPYQKQAHTLLHRLLAQRVLVLGGAMGTMIQGHQLGETEAFAECMHEQVRKEYWGYARDEQLNNEALIRERYRGIRPAPGYPACPDHTEKATLFALLDGEYNASVSLTEHFAMMPAASVSGWYFSHPQASYFGLDKIGTDQLQSHAGRKGWSLAEAKRWLQPDLVDRQV